MLKQCTTDIAEEVGFAHRMLGNKRAGWYIGTFGAIGEFQCVEGDPEPVTASLEAGGQVTTSRGGIRVVIDGNVRPIAYEGLSKRPDAWTLGAAFCLPTVEATMNRRSVLTELGPDIDALKEGDRDGILFDLGVGAVHMDFCVRTSDPNLITVLRREAGRSLLVPGSEAMAAIKKTSPHRICISKLGRVEVYQPIPSRAPGAHAPAGPHTHLLPGLLKSGRTHSANTPIPEGMLPALFLTPEHPATDLLGHPREFDLAVHHASQDIFSKWAPASCVAEKRRITAAVVEGDDPRSYRVAGDRAERKAARVALRQMLHTHPEVPGLSAWLAVFDRGAGDSDANDGH